MALELGWAMQAAFPANKCVDFTTQSKLRQCVRDRSLFALDLEAAMHNVWEYETFDGKVVKSTRDTVQSGTVYRHYAQKYIMK